MHIEALSALRVLSRSAPELESTYDRQIVLLEQAGNAENVPQLEVERDEFVEIPDRMEALYTVMKSRVAAPATREPSGLGGSGFSGHGFSGGHSFGGPGFGGYGDRTVNAQGHPNKYPVSLCTNCPSSVVHTLIGRCFGTNSKLPFMIDVSPICTSSTTSEAA